MICRFCGQKSNSAILFNTWVKPTFTDHDKLLDGNGVCSDCLFWFNERSMELAALVGKDKPQRMRNYSHFIVSDVWIPLSKGSKQCMQDIILGTPFPALAAVADSGQKHIVFRARRNPPNSTCGWVQFEEQSFFLQPQELRHLLAFVETLYATFSKGEIESGNYKSYRIMKFGVDKWQELEDEIKPLRGSLLFKLGIFLAQRRDDGVRAGASNRPTVDNLARHTARLQEQVPAQHLAAVRGPGEKCGIHEQSGQVRQLSLFKPGSDGGAGSN